MGIFSNITRGTGVSKTVGSSPSRSFLTTYSSSRNIWFGKRKFEH